MVVAVSAVWICGRGELIDDGPLAAMEATARGELDSAGVETRAKLGPVARATTATCNCSSGEMGVSGLEPLVVSHAVS